MADTKENAEIVEEDTWRGSSKLSNPKVYIEVLREVQAEPEQKKLLRSD